MYSYYAALTLRSQWPAHRPRLLPPDDSSDAANATDLTSLFLRGLPRSPKVLYRYYWSRQQPALLGWTYRRSAVRWTRAERERLCFCCCDGVGGREAAESIALLSEVERGGFAGKVGSCWEGEGLGWEGGVSAGECGKVGSFREEDRKMWRDESSSGCTSSSSLLLSGELWDGSGRSSGCGEEGFRRRRGRRRLGKEALSGKRLGGSSLANSRRKVGDAVESGAGGRVEKKGYVAEEELGSRRGQERMREENRRLRDEIQRISGTLETKESIMEENRRLQGEMEIMLRASEVKRGVTEENRRLQEEMERVSRASEVKMDIVEENRRLREEMEGILARRALEAKENVIEENRKLRKDLTRISRALEVKGSVTEENRRLREEIERILRVSEVKENMAEENSRLQAEIERLSRMSHENENIEVENRRLGEELERLSRISEVKNSTSEENRRLVDEVDRRLKVSEVKDDVRGENRKLWEEIEKISRTFEVNENIRKKSSYEEISEMKVEDRKEMSALTATLLEEVTRQRQEINQLRDNYESLLRRSLVQDSHVVGMPAPSNAASSSRLEDSEVISTSLASLVEELRRQSMVIEQLSRSYRELASSTLIAKSSSERVSRSEKVFISHLGEREKVSNSTVTTIKEGKDRKEDSGQKGPGSCRASISELSASEKPENPPQGKYISDSREQLTPMDQHREDLQKTGSSELLVYGSNLNPILENALSAQGRQYAGRVDMAEPHESDSRWASSSGKVSVSELEDKLESKIFSNMTYIGNKKERHHYGGQLRIDNEKLFTSSQDSTCMEKPSTGVASAMNVTNLHSKQQHGYADEKIEGSSKYTHVAPANKPAAGAPQDQEANSVIALVHEADKEKVDSFLEKRTSGSITLTTTTSGDSDTSYVSAETHQRLDEKTRAEHLYQVRHDRLESASQFYGSSSQHFVEFANKVEQEMEGLVDLDASTGSSGIHVEETSNKADRSSTSISEEHKQKYIEEEPSQYSVLSEMKQPSEEMQDPTSPFKGPSLADMTRQEYSEVPTDTISLPSSSGNAIVKRAGRSLWSYIADIIRMGWRPHAISQTLTFGSGTRSSSNESMSSDGSFSGGEQDEEDEQTKKRKLLFPKECDPGKRTIAKEKTAGQSSRTDYKRVNMEAETSLTIRTSAGVDSSKESLPVTGPIDSLEGAKVEHGVLAGPQTGLSFMGTTGEVYVSTDSLQVIGSNLRLEAETTGGTSSAVQSVDLTKGGTSSVMQSVDLTTGDASSAVQLVNSAGGGISSAMQSAVDVAAGGISSAVQAVDLAVGGISTSMQAVDLEAGSASSAMQTVDLSSQVDLPISTGVELEIARIDKVPMPKNGNVSRGKKLLKEGSLEIVESEMKDGDLRRRKLQRAKQVPRERFDDWEETRSHESERRKLDEFFMREALLEAKKAAELWEVPIGAVVVQDGKIIARGSNMVEELRDSTAHAEMICIREASNHLKSWRLSETTLYVTLEPCAMCAGAILQARIDSVVWGAPNKLLGADGSWVRLFPGGDEERSATSSQTAAPVHPFHPKITIRRGILEKECADVMQQFFQLRRKKDKEEQPRPSRTSILAYPTKLMAKLHNIFSMMFCL